jgi:hypothetical protein
MNLKEIVCEDVDCIKWLNDSLVVGCVEHSNEPSGSVTAENLTS